MKIWYEWSLFHLLSLFLALHENSCSKCDQNKSTRQKHGKMAITCWEKICSFDILGQCNVCVLFFILILISHLLTTHIVAACFLFRIAKRIICSSKQMWNWKHLHEMKIQNDMIFLLFAMKLLEFVPDQRVTFQMMGVVCIRVSSPWRHIYG